ncbi:MAG: hypothetical protein JXQ72_13135 [Anaerolineae bacterium]|nr:hypothetical protein [Anaerolineae bacterium]
MSKCDSHSGASSALDLLSDFRLLLYLFFGFRLTMAIVYQPYTFDLYEQSGVPTLAERGMSSFGDFRYFYELARLSDDGDLPYRDYWYEFPPVWPAVFIGLYRVMSLRGEIDYASWASALGLIMTVFDVGNLLLLRRLAGRLHGDGMAVALPWLYAVLAAPLIFPWWNFEPLVLFLLLLALLWLLEGQVNRSAVMVAVGTLTKFIPVLVLPVIWRFREQRDAIRYTAIVLVIVLAVLGLMLAWGGDLAMSSLLAQFSKGSYQSIWALLDGNMGTGRFIELDQRFDPDTAYEPVGSDPVIPWWLRLIPFAALGWFVFTRRMRRDDQGVVAFFTLTLVIFFLWAQGWSPQWALTLTPLLLLNFPDRNGVLLCLVIAFASFVEYPALFMRTAETNGEISGALVMPYVMIIVARTALLAGIVGALYMKLTEDRDHAPA